MRVLLIQNNQALHKDLSTTLEALHYQTDIAENIKDAEYLIEIRNYNLIIIDTKFPDDLMVNLILQIKKLSSKTCIIVISPQYSKEAEVQSLRCGADDFLAHPLDLEILLARINARLRLWDCASIDIHDLKIIPKEEKVFFKGNKLEIKGKSFEILLHLVLHKNQIISKEELLDSIWEEPELVTPNVIEVAINQIRQKLDKAFKIKSIETIRKKGYRFCYSKTLQTK